MLRGMSKGSPTVLLVDDEPVLLRVLEVNFRVEGFSVRTAGSGAEALAAAAAEPPDAVVLDLGLPDADGRDLVAELRAMEGLAGTAVVVLSGRDPDVGDDRGYAALVHAHVTKPVEPADLIETVRRAIAESGG